MKYKIANWIVRKRVDNISEDIYSHRYRRKDYILLKNKKSEGYLIIFHGAVINNNFTDEYYERMALSITPRYIQVKRSNYLRIAFLDEHGNFVIRTVKYQDVIKDGFETDLCTSKNILKVHQFFKTW